MRNLTTSDVLEIMKPTGLGTAQLNRWCDLRLIVPVEGGGSQGSPRRYTPIQAVGIAVGAAISNSEQGCISAYIGKVIDAFVALGEERLLAAFAEGNTHFFGILHGLPLLTDPREYWLPDVQAAWERVKSKAGKFAVA